MKVIHEQRKRVFGNDEGGRRTIEDELQPGDEILCGMGFIS